MVLAKDYTWISFLFLPVPIAFLICDISYRKKRKDIHFDTRILVSIILSVYLCIMGSISFTKSAKVNYNEIYKYKNMIGENVPKEGIFVKDKKKSSRPSPSNRTVCNTIIFSKKEEALKFETSIKNNKNWLIKKEIPAPFQTNLFLSSTFHCSNTDICYYSFYNKEENNYNTFPTNKGTYHIYVMIYNSTNTTLIIDEYTLQKKPVQ